MVRLTVIMDGTAYAVDVEREKVVISGTEYTVEEKGGTVEVDGTPYTVVFKEKEVLVNGIPHAVNLESSVKQAEEKKVSSDAGAVTAMMPGKIVDISVKEGDTVEEGHVVCVLEAMKMENELRAPKSGTIKKVHVQPGANVEKGDTLVEIG